MRKSGLWSFWPALAVALGYQAFKDKSLVYALVSLATIALGLAIAWALCWLVSHVTIG